MGASATFARAYLKVEGGSDIHFWFNPTTLQRERRADYNSDRAKGQAAPTLEYNGGSSEALSLTVLLHADGDRTGQDVSTALKALEGLLEATVSVPDTDQRRPPTVTLIWGDYLSNVSVCESLSTTIELFDPEGNPLRALVTMRIVQAQPDTTAGQNPTTRATQRRRQHLVHGGDTIAGIAYAHYGDPTRWRAIAEANGIDDPMRLPVGSLVTVPLEAQG